MKSNLTRRKFLKASTLATGTIIGGSVMARCSGNSDIPEGIALPASMMCGVGNRLIPHSAAWLTGLIRL